MKTMLGAGLGRVCLTVIVLLSLAIVPAVAPGCNTMPDGTMGSIESIISTVGPIVVDVIAAQNSSRDARDEARRALEDRCRRDLARAGSTALHLLNGYQSIVGRKVFTTQQEKLDAWQLAYTRTATWYQTLYDESPEQLVFRLYECANTKPPEDMGWEFYATIALRHLGYEVVPGDITTANL